MVSDFFDIIRYNYSIDQKLEKDLASSVKLAFSLAKAQQSLLNELGYKNLAPLFVDYDPIWFYIKDEKFHTIDQGNGKHTYRRWQHLYGDILLCLNINGYYYCEPSNNNETKCYKVDNGVYYFLWDNDEYLEVKYIKKQSIWQSKDEFEYVKRDNYVAIKYHKKNRYGDSFMSEEERWIEKPLMDTLISREKGICHTEVFIYYYNDKIVVYDGDVVIVYDKEFNILYETHSDFWIWEVNSTSYLLFSFGCIVYELSKGEEIELNIGWNYVKTHKNIAILYSECKNTTGHIFDSSFKLLREFNIIGEISELKEIGDDIVMKAKSLNVDNSYTDAYYNVNGPNVTIYIEEIDDNTSIPDITFRNMPGYEDLFIVKTKVSSSDYINFSHGTDAQYIMEKCGVYIKCGYQKEEYEKIVDCKYDYIISLNLNEDSNIYYIGLTGRNDKYKYDLYINHDVFLQNIPYEKGVSIKLVGKKSFIRFANSDGNFGIIRAGEIIIEPLYEEIRTFVMNEKKYDIETGMTSETLKYLFVVSDGELYGICSPTGKLILPMKYSTIDIDDSFCIILVRDFDLEMDNKCDETVEEMLNYGSIYEIGYYDEEKDVIVTEKAKFKEGKVFLDNEDTYVWDGSFRYLDEGNSPGWTDYNDIAYEGYSPLELGLD